ncbi:MAG: rRNA maturation RNase YbeY [Proteobacteria bacterium]|jgi:probable rRNA maturation factor|nr:rRNA maturation RNase YbeY [Alphaproteobacteria bacterium]NCC02957.1 rRNA maturation RNase YbeY [Pseudomonadota bacterium]
MKKNRPVPLFLTVASVPWSRITGLEKRLQAAAALTLAVLPEALLPVARQAEANVLLTTDRAVQRLNRDFRGKDKPTNVLSFPQFEARDLMALAKKRNFNDKNPICVGDIAIAYGTVAKEAKAEGKTILDHATHLTIHGLLHLFGYDHDTLVRANKMEKVEKEVMASLGLPDPYEPLAF